VFAREFFPDSKRGQLSIVPACEACNNAKSALEHYLTAVLPFGGRHPDSHAMLREAVPRRLARNRKLHRELVAGSMSLAGDEKGQRVESLVVPFDSNKYVKLFNYIARGLTAYHWQVVVPVGHEVEAVLLNPVYEPHYRRLLSLPAGARVDESVGDGAFAYRGAQAIDDPALTIWWFQTFGGLVMAGDNHLPDPHAYTVWVTTGWGHGDREP